jgi:hypothetical protein
MTNNFRIVSTDYRNGMHYDLRAKNLLIQRPESTRPTYWRVIPPEQRYPAIQMHSSVNDQANHICLTEHTDPQIPINRL